MKLAIAIPLSMLLAACGGGGGEPESVTEAPLVLTPPSTTIAAMNAEIAARKTTQPVDCVANPDQCI